MNKYKKIALICVTCFMFSIIACAAGAIYNHNKILKNLQTQIEELQKTEKDMKEFKEKQKIVNQKSLVVFDEIINAIRVIN